MKKMLQGIPTTTTPLESAITITTEEKDGVTSKTVTVELSTSGATKGAAIGLGVAGSDGGCRWGGDWRNTR